MALYHGPRCRQCRREGTKLMLKGERCKTENCAVEKRPFPPGARQVKRKRQATEYNAQLREKQKIRRIYGVLEKQFVNYFAKASKSSGVTGEVLLRFLEMRLDNIVFRFGFAPSRSAARQLVLHNHFSVNGRKVNLPSYQLKAGDVVTVKEKSKNLQTIHNALKNMRDMPEWLSVDKVKLEGSVVNIPDRAAMPVDAQEHLIVELYSR
jgi:small subunit ribosomal protein S4